MLRTQGLWVEDRAQGQTLLRGIDFRLAPGRVTVLLGASGAGKTLLARSLCGLLPAALRVRRGAVFFRGQPMGPGDWRNVRGREVFYAPQNAAASFNPVLAMGRQIGECAPGWGAGDLQRLLARLGLPDPARVLRSYPHELSGGENQRCLLALALACGAGTLLLDEPTAEIDAGAQEDFIALLRQWQRGRGLTVLLVSHQLGFVRRVADVLCVLAAGSLVARAPDAGGLAACGHDDAREIARCLEGE